jgi:hypothetical protein
MEPRTVRRLLWLTFVCTLPVPYRDLEVGFVPAAWLVLVGGVTVAAAVVDGGEVTGIFAKLLGVQALVMVGLTWVLARFVTAIIVRTVPAARRPGVVGALVVACAAAALLDVFRSTLIGAGAPTNLLGIFG